MVQQRKRVRERGRRRRVVHDRRRRDTDFGVKEKESDRMKERLAWSERPGEIREGREHESPTHRKNKSARKRRDGAIISKQQAGQNQRKDEGQEQERWRDTESE